MYDMSTVVGYERIPMSWADYEDLGDNVRGEYVDREFVISPSPSRRHQNISFNMATALKTAATKGLQICEAWAWKTGGDEFIPDVMVFRDTDDQIRLTATPHLAIEILSSDPAADLPRKARKYAAAGLEHYWVIDGNPKGGLAGPEIIEFRLCDGVLQEVARHLGADPVELSTRQISITIVPDRLAD